MRIDIYLVEKGFAATRSRAQDLIGKGRVLLVTGGNKQVIKKSSHRLESTTPDNWSVEIIEDIDGDRFVSRGGLKMQGALEHTRLKVENFNVLDLGISTGGFTDCLLQAGAASVLGVDVGHGQLAPRLALDSRVTLVEGVNARQLSVVLVLSAPAPLFDLVVIDVSFISLTLVLPEAIQYLKESGHILALVKPQFEVGRSGLSKGGIVKNVSLYKEVEAKIRQCCHTVGIQVEDYFESSIDGTDGNREFFVLASPAQLSMKELG